MHTENGFIYYKKNKNMTAGGYAINTISSYETTDKKLKHNGVPASLTVLNEKNTNQNGGENLKINYNIKDVVDDSLYDKLIDFVNVNYKTPKKTKKRKMFKSKNKKTKSKPIK